MAIKSLKYYVLCSFKRMKENEGDLAIKRAESGEPKLQKSEWHGSGPKNRHSQKIIGGHQSMFNHHREIMMEEAETFLA